MFGNFTWLDRANRIRELADRCKDELEYILRNHDGVPDETRYYIRTIIKSVAACHIEATDLRDLIETKSKEGAK